MSSIPRINITQAPQEVGPTAASSTPKSSPAVREAFNDHSSATNAHLKPITKDRAINQRESLKYIKPLADRVDKLQEKAMGSFAVTKTAQEKMTSPRGLGPTQKQTEYAQLSMVAKEEHYSPLEIKGEYAAGNLAEGMEKAPPHYQSIPEQTQNQYETSNLQAATQNNEYEATNLGAEENPQHEEANFDDIGDNKIYQNVSQRIDKNSTNGKTNKSLPESIKENVKELISQKDLAQIKSKLTEIHDKFMELSIADKSITKSLLSEKMGKKTITTHIQNSEKLIEKSVDTDKLLKGASKDKLTEDGNKTLSEHREFLTSQKGFYESTGTNSKKLGKITKLLQRINEVIPKQNVQYSGLPSNRKINDQSNTTNRKPLIKPDPGDRRTNGVAPEIKGGPPEIYANISDFRQSIYGKGEQRLRESKSATYEALDKEVQYTQGGERLKDATYAAGEEILRRASALPEKPEKGEQVHYMAGNQKVMEGLQEAMQTDAIYKAGGEAIRKGSEPPEKPVKETGIHYMTGNLEIVDKLQGSEALNIATQLSAISDEVMRVADPNNFANPDSPERQQAMAQISELLNKMQNALNIT